MVEKEEESIKCIAEMKGICMKFYEFVQFAEEKHCKSVRVAAHYGDICLTHFRSILKSAKQLLLDN